MDTHAHPIRFDVDYPDRSLDRTSTAFRLFAALPIVVAWFAILVTGRYPRPIFDYVTGVLRWSNRVTGYAFTLVTDRYPPFSLR